MFKTNEYFDGRVKSIAFQTADGPATMGVMAPGDYEFGTTTIENMTVVSGIMEVLLPNETSWKEYKPFQTFVVAKNEKFKLRISIDSAYVCLYH
ncbi:MAG: pyrimidine/purine nucleoside phosphorylase [Bacteroidales bacterium]|nr:pyrimidine/purine nucleoside phosphorylase [Bacteroidales bacterium]MDD4602821.1 pyrimidine/purine nucleoside phosphorylase [Bacteroidales bacterium]